MIVPDKIIRSARKTLAVSVDPFGRVTVRAPKSCSEERIFSFLRKKEAWILRTKSKMQRAGIDLPPENLDGYAFLLLGQRYEITLVNERFVRLDDMQKRIYLPEKKAKDRLVQWLKENAKRILSTVTERKAREMQTSYKSVTVNSARGRWGSCSYDNALHYSFRLLFAPKDVVEYVVVHELAHTKHKNHSAAFWQEVEKYVPDYREKRKWLKDRGILMQVF
ncbi:MAG: M48 family metallopeptidase [Clostridia bacterium]|nr:M48 family metallopeptidase [Clostridia bacterium]